MLILGTALWSYIDITHSTQFHKQKETGIYTTLSRIQVRTLPLKSEMVSKLINLKGS